MDIKDLAEKCMLCRSCGLKAAHRTWPLLGYFPPEAKILVIGQNPAEPKIMEEFWEFREKFHLKESETDPLDYLIWYEGWLKKSMMVKALNSFFGTDWIFSGNFAVTNAVRCRTVNNTRPSELMTDNCERFTKAITPDYKFLVAMGGIARKQLGFRKGGVPTGTVLHILETDQYMLYLNHYAWRPKDGDRNEEMRKAKQFVKFALR